jgi:phosphoribosylglycinamide formyltransferase-1
MMTMTRKRTAVLISGRGSNMAALIEAAQQPDYPAEVVLVVANVADAAGLKRAEAARIATAVVDHRPYGRDREGFERALDAALTAHRIEIVCLAGFMRLLTPWLVGRWHGRMINIHPSLLPAFKGLDTHARAIAAGVKIHGATVHFVVPETDAGPIIVQAAVPVRDDDTADSLAARVLEAEHRIYPFALAQVAAGNVRILEGRCLIAGSTAGAGALVVPPPDPTPTSRAKTKTPGEAGGR